MYRVLKVVFEQLLDFNRVGPLIAQEGSRLKGPAVDPDREILGVQHNAGHQGRQLAGQDRLRVDRVGQQLRDQLAGGGGKGLMQIQGGIGDVVRSAAVMIDHGDAGDGFQQGLALHLIRPVRIHHHQQAVRIR